MLEASGAIWHDFGFAVHALSDDELGARVGFGVGSACPELVLDGIPRTLPAAATLPAVPLTVCADSRFAEKTDSAAAETSAIDDDNIARNMVHLRLW